MQLNITESEQNLISIAQNIIGEEFSLIRITPTMLKKSIIDAVGLTRKILKDNHILDYYSMSQGEPGKIYLTCTFLTIKPFELKVSCYRPKTKKGDPRIWFYGLKSWVGSDHLLMFTVKNGQLFLIPIIPSLFSEKSLKSFFKDDESSYNELMSLIMPIISGEPLLSCSPLKLSPKDVGETLETALNILPNNSIYADFKDDIEIKAKGSSGNTKDTLFSMVPNWEISEVISAKDMILEYGYPSKKEKYATEDFIDLYVTVSSNPNPQGLFLEVDYDNELIIQKSIKNGKKVDTVYWKFEDVKERLYNKHPKTLWVKAETLTIEDQIYFDYHEVIYTKRPVFSSFLLLIEQGIVTYDWRGRVKSDGTKYKDKGHCFRINPKKKHLLFSEIEYKKINETS